MAERGGGHLPDFSAAELPPPPASAWRIVGPGVVAAGVGLASGEFILFPYIASQVGLVFLWAAAVGLATQFFINMEIERYTLATGETVLTGFSRLGRHWGLVFALLAILANLWPGWVTGAATLTTYLVGGDARWIAVGMLAAIGFILTLSPVVYRTLEGAQFVKVIAVGLLVAVAAAVAIPTHAWVEAPALAAQVRIPAAELGWALLLGALAYAGAGGGQNLCQSNWIRDKGLGMGAHAPKIESPLTGEPVAAPGTGWTFTPDEANMARWRGWWRIANIEQLSTFVAITFVTIAFTSILAFSTLYGRPDLPRDISFLNIEGETLSATPAIGSGACSGSSAPSPCSRPRSASSIIPAASPPTCCAPPISRRKSESLVYAWLVWGIVAAGIAAIASGLSQPLVLLVTSACIAAFMMFVYSALLILLNRRLLAPELRPAGYRIAALVWAVGLFGILTAITVADQVGKLFG